jgi:hypothetical protein
LDFDFNSAMAIADVDVALLPRETNAWEEAGKESGDIHEERITGKVHQCSWQEMNWGYNCK